LTQSRQTQHQHTHMLWDSDLPIQEYTDTHVYTTIYDQGSFVPVARLSWLRDDLPRVANDDIESLDNENEQDGNLIQVYHYHNDQLGTPNELTNEKGEVVWLADYEAWGEARVEICWVSRVKNSLGNCFSGARRNDSAVKLVPQDESCARVGGEVLWREQVIDQIQVSQNELQPIRFQGQHFDEETGLHYNRFRYYDPDMGMFTTRDPIGLRGGDNVFAYAPNPTGFIDPLGLEKGPYGLGGGPYSQHNTIKRNKIDWGVSKSISNWRKNPHGPFGGICGAEGTTAATWVPDAVWTNECAEHDRCYSDCSKTKYQCDGAFFRSGAPLQSIALQTVFKKDSTKAYKDAQSKAGCCNDCIK
ncbi:RHS repeat domain-containing protein, partial [Psychrobacter sp. HII-4]|uniref:RHS repeat domain-containing protein n=1 Tax=Psychrobacter sp. HII-4 TaxID=1569264 RepID=UPI001D100C51